MTNKMTPIVVPVHRRHFAMIHIAHAIIIRTRGLRRQPPPPPPTMGGYYGEGAT
jgi:hypothetical protein